MAAGSSPGETTADAAPLRPLAAVWLLASAAVGGGVVMAVELLGARMLSVGYGGSLTVWAAMISVTLLSLAVGYFLGGYLADRFPRPGLLYANLLLAAVLVVLFPHTRFVLKACHGALGLKGGALASSALIFFLPLALMGMVSPAVIRLLAAGGHGVGVTAGGVYAISTVGSVVGTLLTGLWLIPTFGTGTGFRIAAVALAAAAALGLVITLGLKGGAALLVPVGLVFLPGPAARVGSSYAAPDGETATIRAVRESAHGHMTVIDKGSYRLLVVNGIVQTGIPRNISWLRKGYCLDINYFQELLPYTVKKPEKTNALIIGLAGGMTASMLKLHGVQVHSVDLDPEIIALAREHFCFTGPAVAADGRRYLEDCAEKYDFCVIDTYSGDVFPFHLASREAFEAAKGVLKPGGILALNYIGSPKGRAFACTHLTLEAVFRNVLAIGFEPGDAEQTITLFASGRPIEFNGRWLDDGGDFAGIDTVGEAIDRLTLKPARKDAFVLTDDYNPIDFLRAGEALRWRERTTAKIIGEGAIF